MHPAAPFAGGAALVLALAGQAFAQEPAAEGDQPRSLFVAAKMIKQRDADRALRETLRRAVDSASVRLGAPGAFTRSPKRHIGLPGALNSLRGAWNAVGRSGALDALEDAMNRGAETAAPMARETFQDIVERVDFSDAVAVVLTGDAAATQLLAARERADLERRLRPLIETALNGSGAFAALDQAAAAANSPKHAAAYRPAVIDATLSAVLDAYFAEMGARERAIRADPEAQGSPLLREVFSVYRPPSTDSNAGG
ncbi:MAG TPA: DUF4197 domain-containing protein [Caulobacterales bacterium]|jgi:hypothetical protein|nr:DUF4197 domain-containing protein [Caulobacterales bacterium]